MAIKYTTMIIILIGVCLLLIGSVGAAAPISTIRPGNTVFIGESGLDITAAMDGDTILGWWASGASIAGSSPDYHIMVSNPASFSVYAGDFGTHTGNWYHMSSLTTANGTAFAVIDPQLDLRIEDTTVNVDVTDKWVPTGDELRFRIDSNLAQITQRTGVTSVPVTIKVQSPEGGIFTTLVNNAGTATQIVDYPVTTTPQYTSAIWGTGNRAAYPPGNYQVWAVCNVNSMNDNYGQTGKTISTQISLLDQDNNPLIGNKGYVTNPSTSATTVPAGTTPSTATPTMTSVITTVPPTTIVPTVSPTVQETVVTEVTPIPSSTRMKSPGFESACVLFAILVGIVFFIKKD